MSVRTEEGMGYLIELENFFDSIQNCSARNLSRKQLIENYLQYMSKEYGYDEGYYLKQFDEKGKDYSDFNEYIYKFYMGLTRDLRVEYDIVEHEAKERVKLYEKRVSDLNNLIQSIPSSEKYIRGKYNFFLRINDELLQKAREARKKEKVFRKALNNCRKIANSFWGNWFYDSTFSDIQQYVNVDWKSKINFIEASIVKGEELTKIKHSDHGKYLVLFKKYIDEYDILERLLCVVSNNYYLQNRQEIITEAVNLFRNGNYIPFVYLLVPQIEGLFDVYKIVLRINNDEGTNGLVEKLDIINKYQRIWGYIYYAFEFPVLRNDIAHGNMVEVTPEMAYDTLMDVFYLFHEIESSDREYKIILDFLENFLCKQPDDDIEFVLEYFSGSLNLNEKLAWLKRCLDGNYDGMLAWYNYLDALNKLKGLFESEKFRSSIYNQESLEIKKNVDFNGEQFSCISINRKVEMYMPLLNVLENYIAFPSKWISDVRQRLNEIDKKVDERLLRLANQFKNELLINSNLPHQV